MNSINFSLARLITMLIALTVAIAPFFVSAQMLVNEDYEDGSFADSGNPSGNAPTISSGQSNSGSQSMKVFLNRETGGETGSAKYRTEVTVTPMNSGSPLRFQYDEEYWIGFSTYLVDWETDVWDEILLQWHGYPDQNLGETWRNPTVAFRTQNGNYIVTIKGDSDPVNVIRDYDRSVSHNIGPHAGDSNQWVNWVIRYIPSHSGNGVFQMWKDGDLVVDDAGINTYNDVTRPYLKTGIYKPAWRDESWTPAIEDLTVLERLNYRDDLKVYRGTNGYDMVATPVGQNGSTPTPTPPPNTSGFTIGAEVVVNGDGARVNTRGPQNPVTLTFEDWLGVHTDGDTGSIISGPVYEPSSGLSWWEVNFDSGVDGWVRQDLLALVNIASTPSPTPTPTPTPTPSPTLPAVCNDGSLSADFVSDFENGTLDLSGTDFTRSGNAPTITQEMARNGDYAMRTYLNRLESSTSYRTEVTLVGSNAEGGRVKNARFGEDTWYGFSIYVPEDYGISSTWEILAQWHDEPNSWTNPNLGRNNPPLSLGIEQDYWRMNNVWDRDPVTVEGDWRYDGSYHARQSVMGDVDYGTWTDWVFRIRWSYGDDGILQVWKNGELVVDRTGPNTYNDRLGPYFKMGLYKGWRDRNVSDSVVDRLLYHDELRVNRGGTYADVAPECYAAPGTNPSPQPTPSPNTSGFTVGAEVTVNGDGSRVNTRGPQNPVTLTFEDWLGVHTDGDTGSIISGPVYEPSSGLSWWEVNFDEGVDGWVRQDLLEVVGGSTPAPVVTSEFDIGDVVVVDDNRSYTNTRGPQNPNSLVFEDWLGLHLSGDTGTVVSGPVYEPSSGLIWLEVDFDEGTDGWVREDALDLYSDDVDGEFGVGRNVVVDGDGSRVNVRGPQNPNTLIFEDWLGQQVDGSEGVIVGGSVYEPSSGFNWWKVNFAGGADGWVRQDLLSLIGGEVVTQSTMDPEDMTPVLNSVEVVGQRTAELHWSLPASDNGVPQGGYEIVLNGTDVGTRYQANDFTTNTDQTDDLTTTVYPTWDGERCFAVQAVWSQFTPTVIESSNELCVTVHNGRSDRVEN